MTDNRTALAGAPAHIRAADWNRSRTYGRTAAALHWATAALILAILPLGLYGANVEGAGAQVSTNIHKMLGLCVLFLSLARLAWRLLHPAPPLPPDTAPLARLAAHGVHAAFYVLLIALPLLGWLMSSAFPRRHPIGIPGILELPFLPTGANMALAGWTHSAHVVLGFAMTGLVAVHIAAALKHHFLDRDALILRMLPD